MKPTKHLVFTSCLFILSAAVTACGGGSSTVTPAPTVVALDPLVEVDKTDQLILKYKVDRFNGEAIDAAEATRLSKSVGVTVAPVRAMSDGAQVIKLDAKITVLAAIEIANKLMLDPLVQYVEPDQVMISHQTALTAPTDPQYVNQWSYSGATLALGGANVVGAWSVTTGLTPTVVAVIDTGMLQHTDLVGRYVPGYDFITGALNGDGSCVVSSGNDYYDMAYASPANYTGVISVGSVTKFGNHANYFLRALRA
jgi:hypothetical protein